MDKKRREKIYELLKRGLKHIEKEDELPSEWARELFPPEKREYDLTYYGKETVEQILADTMALPLQPVSTFGQNGGDWQNKLIFGDNLQALKTLVAMKERGELTNADGVHGARLIYIDPPFATKREFRGSQDAKAYQDKIAGAEFLEFLRKRLIFLHELLANDGCIYLHLDWKKAHYVKVLMDEIFGENNFLGDISWYYYNKMASGTRKFPSAHDRILFYAKNKNTDYTFNPIEEKRDVPVKQLKRKYFEGRAVNVKDDSGAVQYQIREVRRVDDVWRIACLQPADKTQNSGYPTQKPEALLARIIEASSKEGDIVLDAFAGAGTTCAVAEKMNRKWIAIDCGKLAIYTIQKRLLNLRRGVGNVGAKVNTKPFTLYNAGLYDFETLRNLPWQDWRSMALQLFECRDELHKIKGFQLDGKRQGASVLVFDHFSKGVISRETITDLHASIGKHVGDRCFIIAPRGVFLFQEDYIELDNVRYYALRIPYSYINELHRREFSALSQPIDETSVNETVDAVGFDFIQPPVVELETKISEGSISIKIKKFESRARIRGEERLTKHDALSMVMVDYDYDGKVFDLDDVFYAGDLRAKSWKMEVPISVLKDQLMLVFLDIYGNESKIIIPKKQASKKVKAVRRPVRA